MAKSTTTRRLGTRVRAVRRQRELTQVRLAEQLGISASYLNLIENNRRPLPGHILIRLVQVLEVDLSTFADEDEGRLVSELLEAFADPIFEEEELLQREIRDLVIQMPGLARAVLKLYGAYQNHRELADDLSSQMIDSEHGTGASFNELPSEEVSDFLQQHLNHFPDLESAAEHLWVRAPLRREHLFGDLASYLAREHDVNVRVVPARHIDGLQRHFDADSRELLLSELLPTRSRKFQLASQLGLLEHGEIIARLVDSPKLTTEMSRALGKVALSSYFAAAILMPYEPFWKACREARYDIDVVGRRFGVSFEQVCHRMTSLHRPGMKGVPFHFVRIDVAGNISKRFSASGIPIPRFSGLCPRWNVFQAFSMPGRIQRQLSSMPDGSSYFCIARTVQADSHGFNELPRIHAVGLGCQVDHAKEMIYADGFDLKSPSAYGQIGRTCRLCERTDCDQRAFPSMNAPLRINLDRRGTTLYSQIAPSAE